MSIELEDVKRLHLEPGDGLVIRVPNNLTAEQSFTIRELVGNQFAGHPVLVLAAGCELQVVPAAT